MKNILLSTVILSLLIFTGCSSKVDVEDENFTPVEEAAVAPMNVDGEQDDAAAQVDAVTGDAGGLASVYFDFDKFDVSSSNLEIITDNAKLINAAGGKIKLEGNCDEWGSNEYNVALGLKRATAVKKALVAEGIDADNVSTASNGESNPVCEAKTSECFAKNRRVDINILP